MLTAYVTLSCFTSQITAPQQFTSFRVAIAHNASVPNRSPAAIQRQNSFHLFRKKNAQSRWYDGHHRQGLGHPPMQSKQKETAETR